VTSPFNPYQAPGSDEAPQSGDDGEPGTPQRATLGQRFAAAVLDSLISLVILLPLEWKAGKFDGFPKIHTPTFAENALWLAISYDVFLTVHGYWLSKGAQTVGKRILGIRIVDRRTGAPAAFVKLLLLRYLPVSAVVLVPVVGPFLSMVDVVFIFRRNRRCLHDELAGTIVMKVT